VNRVDELDKDPGCMAIDLAGAALAHSVAYELEGLEFDSTAAAGGEVAGKATLPIPPPFSLLLAVIAVRADLEGEAGSGS